MTSRGATPNTREPWRISAPGGSVSTCSTIVFGAGGGTLGGVGAGGVDGTMTTAASAAARG